MENILKNWSHDLYDDGKGSDDVLMEDGSDAEQQLTSLRRLIENFKPQIDHNQWLQSMIASL
jgi:DNA mismatch repair protein MSH2